MNVVTPLFLKLVVLKIIKALLSYPSFEVMKYEIERGQ